MGRRRPGGGAPLLLHLRRGAAQRRAHLRRAGLLHHPGRHPHHPRPAHRRLADLPGRAAPRRRRPAPGDAGDRRHARRHQRCRVRTQRPGHRGPPPAAEPRARRRRRPATEPLPLARRPGAPARSSGRPAAGDRAPRRGRAGVLRRLRPERAPHRRAAHPTPARSWRPGLRVILGGHARPGRRRRALLPARVRAHHLGDGAAGPTPGRARTSCRARGADGCSSGCWPQRRRAAGWAT